MENIGNLTILGITVQHHSSASITTESLDYKEMLDFLEAKVLSDSTKVIIACCINSIDT